MRGFLGYVLYCYDAIVVVNFVVVEFIRDGVYDRAATTPATSNG